MGPKFPTTTSSQFLHLLHNESTHRQQLNRAFSTLVWDQRSSCRAPWSCQVMRRRSNSLLSVSQESKKMPKFCGTGARVYFPLYWCWKKILGVKFHAYWEKVSLVQFHPCIVIKRYRWMTPLQPSVTKWPSTLPGTTQRTTECHRPTNTCLSHCSYLVLPCFPFFLGCLNWAFGSINHSYSLAWYLALHLQASPVSGPRWIYPRQPTI